MDTLSDSFEYILQLTKSLSAQCWGNRQETLKIEQLLKRLAKQAHISYDQFTNEPIDETEQEHVHNSTMSEEERLVNENYKLIYIIEQQEYLNNKLWTLISQINELIVSIKSFIIDQKSIRPESELDFIERNVINKAHELLENQKLLQSYKESSSQTLIMLLNELEIICRGINWDQLPQDTVTFKKLKHRINKVAKTHNITLIPIT